MVGERRLDTFRKMTVFVMVIWLFNLSFIIWGQRASPLPLTTEKWWCALVHTPLFIFLDVLFVAFGFWMIRRFRHRYIGACIAFYGILLGNILGVIDAWVSCHLRFR
jgi:hypothetical protein